MFTAEQQAAIDAMIAKAVETAEAKAEATAAKNKELLGELKKARKNSEIDPDEYQRALDQVDELQSKLGESTKANKTALLEAEKYKKLHESESGFTSKLLVDNGLMAELTAAGVKKELLDGAKALIERQVKIEQDGENRVAKVGDKILKDFVTEWAGSDIGKNYVAAPANSGGGSQGGGGKAAAKTMPRASFDGLGKTEQATFMQTGGSLTD
jgi:multidrug efflux pump subunit AcrA (membrane-fusion protein)